MTKIRHVITACLVMLAVPLASCASVLGTQTAGQASTISRTALDFAFNSFDAALYGFDFAMDLGKPAPGSAQAKSIAAAGRKVLAFLNAAETARKAGNATSYDQAFAQALSALSQFRSLLGTSAPHAMVVLPKPVDRQAVLARAAA